ncbi:MAG TPA: hypothetical protein VNB24_10255 [Acidimicrobiales bacterium]|nr:hypothetical protein [Acidimicrobiales bacterium]
MRLAMVGVGDFGRAVIGEARQAGIDVAVVPDGLGDDALVAVVASRPVPSVAHELDRAGQPLVPVWGVDGALQVGPVITRGAPCFACYEARLRQHAVDLEAHDAIASHWVTTAPPPPTERLSRHAPTAAAELARILAAPDASAGWVWRFDGSTTSAGRVIARHRCQCRSRNR